MAKWIFLGIALVDCSRSRTLVEPGLVSSRSYFGGCNSYEGAFGKMERVEMSLVVVTQKKVECRDCKNIQARTGGVSRLEAGIVGIM